MNFDFATLGTELERVYTPRLALRPLALADAWPIYQATQHELFNRYLLWAKPDAEGPVIERVDGIVDLARRGRLAAVSAVVRETGEWVSLFRFQPHGSRTDRVEMGIWTHWKHWTGRVSLELGKACVDAAFALSDIDVLVGAAAPGNKPSCRLMELCGLTATNLVTRKTESGVGIELLEHEITREQWLSRRTRADFLAIETRHRPAPFQAPPVSEQIIIPQPLQVEQPTPARKRRSTPSRARHTSPAAQPGQYPLQW